MHPTKGLEPQAWLALLLGIGINKGFIRQIDSPTVTTQHQFNTGTELLKEWMDSLLTTHWNEKFQYEYKLCPRIFGEWDIRKSLIRSKKQDRTIKVILGSKTHQLSFRGQLVLENVAYFTSQYLGRTWTPKKKYWESIQDIVHSFDNL